LRAGFAWVLAGNATTSLSNIVVLSLLAKLSGAVAVGQYTLGVTAGSIVLGLFDLGLRSVQATDARRSYAFSEYLGLRIVGVAAGLSALGLVSLAAGYRPATQAIVMLVGVQLAVQSVADIFYGLYLQRERTPRMGMSMVLRATGTVLAGAVTLAGTRNVVAACGAMAAVSGAVLVFFDYPYSRMLTADDLASSAWRPPYLPSFVWPRLAALAALSLPLGLTLLINVLNVHVSRIVVAHYLGEARLGIFAASAQVTLAGNILLTALGNAASPRMARYFARGEYRAFLKLFFRFVGFAGAIGCGILLVGITAGRPLLTILFNPEFARHLDVFLWLTAAAAVHYLSVCFGVGLTVSRHFRQQLQIGTAALATTVAASTVLIPTMGLVGAGVAAFATATARLLGLSIVFFQMYRRRVAETEGATA